MTINGYYNEFDFIKILNNKYVFEINVKMKGLLNRIFGKINENDYIYCYKSFKTDKADIVIVINNIKKYISIKSGKNNSVHLEHIKEFEKFLEDCMIPQKIIEIYKNYHYAMDSDGKRLNAKEYQKNNEEDILIFNNYINKNDIVKKAINRFLFKGIHDYNNYVDGVIYGTSDNFYVFTRQEIIDFLMEKMCENFNCIHFSSLCLQPWTRNLNYNSKYEYRRDYVQVKWYRLEELIDHIN